MSIQLKHIDLIELPILGLIIAETCLLLIILDLTIFTFLIRNIGIELWLPKGPSLFISSNKSLFIADAEISESNLFILSVDLILFE